MRPLLLLLTILSSTLCAAPPNIVIILADDLGYGDLQCLNPTRGKIPTPHLDRLAAQGMTFTDAHSGSSVCTPTRYGLLTGRYAWRTRLQKGVLDGGNDAPLIAEDRLTLPSFLKHHGYTTACIGKWHLGFQSDAAPRKAKGKQTMGESGLPVGARIIGGPTTRGFDLFWGCSNARTMASLIEGDQVVEAVPPIEMLPRLTQRTVDYIATQSSAAQAGTPFFLYVPLTSPHTPILPSPEWQGKSPLGPYADFVMQTDACVGQMLAALDAHALAENTLVFFSSDNGCSPQAKTAQLEAQGHFASAHYRGYKADIWDGGHRVPFLVRWPAKIAAASSSSQLICLTDLLATCADLLEASLPETAAEDSVSLLPALLGTATQPLRDTATQPLRDTAIHHSIDGRFSIRQGDWKLVLCAGSGGWSQPKDQAAIAKGLPAQQLYDLKTDPAETINLIASHPEIASRLSELLQQDIAAGRSTPGAPQANDVAVTSPSTTP
jgi:arylsulfatase A